MTEARDHDSEHGSNYHDKVVLCLLIEHVLSRAATSFRYKEIHERGKPGADGVYTAPREQFLKFIEVFVDCILIGYIFNHMTALTDEQFHSQAFLAYYIILDTIIMFFI